MLAFAGNLPEGLVKQIIAIEYQGKAPVKLDPPIAAWPNRKVQVREDGATVFGIYVYDMGLSGPVGSAGPEMMFYLEEGGRYRKICAEDFQCDTLTALKTRSNGLADLRVTHKYKDLPTEVHVLKYDGQQYREAAKKPGHR